ncbi:MAG: SDR family NAD(P)-dependent oxidoreductase [Bacteroidales bacterium]|nr:SDR family NAD(P)-dependent oxidoreductase [Bacteroidales bacterium]
MNGTGKYALVTGASSGIGRQISVVLAQQGYNIIAVSNQPEQLYDLKEKLEQCCSIKVHTLNIDLAKENSADQIFDFCENNKLEVEVLINNAGILVFGEVMKVEYSQLKTIVNLHMTTPAFLCRLFGAIMILRKKGFILNVSSISAVMPYPGISLYGPTKAFLRYYTRALRTEMKSYGVHVTCLIPGATATALYNANNINMPLLMRLGIVKKPETVALKAVKALSGNRAECIPGLLNKLIILLLPCIPHFVISLIHKHTDFVKKN